MSRAGFFARLNYSSVNEDWRPETTWLPLGENDRVLCITGSGSRPLDLLSCGAAHVHAVDMSIAQHALLHLKCAALSQLDFTEYLSFLGVVDGSAHTRRSILPGLLDSMHDPVRSWWQANVRLVERGVIYQGCWERYFHRAARLTELFDDGFIRALFDGDDLHAQRSAAHERWNSARWRIGCAAAFSPLALRYGLRDPAFLVHAGQAAGSYVHARIADLLQRRLARESSLLSLALRGVLSDHDTPPSLGERGAALARARLHLLTSSNCGIIEHLESVDCGTYTGFSLSDVGSYLDRTGFDRLLRAMVRAAAPGARFVLRQFLVRHPIARELGSVLVRDVDAERAMAVADRSFAYDFIAGHIRHVA